MTNYDEAYAHWQEVEQRHAAARARLTRRGFLRGSTILAMGGVAAALVGCGAEDEPGETPDGRAPSANGTAPTGEARPASERAHEVFGPPETAYPLVNEYNWRYVDWWAGPPRSGGVAVRAGRGPAHWDPLTVVTLTPHPPFYNGLYRPRVEAGDTLLSIDSLNLDGQEFVPDLAQSVETNADFTEWVFTLPDDVRFHDLEPVNGREMTAEDVVFSFDLYRTSGLWSVPLQPVDAVTAVDDRTVKFTMKHPYMALPAILGMPYYLIVAQEHYEGPETRWREQPIGTGPFVMTQFEPGQSYEGARNTEYWEHDRNGTRLPYLDGFEARFYPDFNAGMAAFRSGAIDSFAPGNPPQLEQLVSTVPEAYYVVGPHWATYQNAAIIQWDNPILADVRVRQALSMGINREDLVERLLDGAGTPYTPVPFDQMGLDRPPSWQDMPPTMQHNPERARELLREAGHEGLTLTMMTPSPAPEIFVGVRQHWRDIGVNLEFEELDFLVFQERLASKDFSHLAFYSGVAGFDADVAVRPLYYPGSPQNWGNINDPTLTELMDRMQLSVDASEREQVARDFSDRAYDQVVAMFINGYHTYAASQPWFHSFAQSLYTTANNWALHCWRYFWLDESAPNR